MSEYTSAGSIATAAHSYIDSIPTAVSGAMITYASGAMLALGAILNESITAPIAASRQDVLIRMTAVSALQRMQGIGVDYSYALGDFSVNKSKATNLEGAQIEALMNVVNQQVRGLGRKVVISKVNG